MHIYYSYYFLLGTFILSSVYGINIGDRGI